MLSNEALIHLPDPLGDTDSTSGSKRIFRKAGRKSLFGQADLLSPTHHSMLIAAHPITSRINPVCLKN